VTHAQQMLELLESEQGASVSTPLLKVILKKQIKIEKSLEVIMNEVGSTK
jgi:hypothetical protein